jgi:beta-glucosidase
VKSKSTIVCLFVAATGVLFATQSLRAEAPAYLDGKQPLETRVEDLLGRLTLEEKIQLCHADSKFTSAAIPRLGIPRRWLSDGPHGVREDVGPDTWDVAGRTDDFATALPAAICLAATIPNSPSKPARSLARKPASAARTSCSARA